MNFSTPDFLPYRRRMVEDQLLPRGIRDQAVIDAMSVVPRERFVEPGHLSNSYDDCALPIGYGQTISQPFIVAYMCQLLELERSHHVLEIGCGSGYMAAVLAHLVQKVVAVERIEALFSRAQKVLAHEEETGKIKLILGDGTYGVPDLAPFERIVVSASIPSSEPPPLLLKQLKTGGILVCPMGVTEQYIQIFHKKEDGLKRRLGLPVSFVPFISDEK